ncbi:hypothetical protein GNX14_22110 [Mesorhizobium japonicum]|nr:hypothetical protein [Mesorhizobium japonicum]
MRSFDLFTLRFVAHPSSVSALRADPPSPTRGEGGGRYIFTLSAFGSYIGFSEASAANRSPAISIS